MKIKKILQRTVKLELHCDCGGQFIFTGMSKSSMPPWYVHECNKCKKISDIHGNYYPRIVNEDVDVSDECNK